MVGNYPQPNKRGYLEQLFQKPYNLDNDYNRCFGSNELL